MKMQLHYETLAAIRHGLFVVQADAPGYPVRFVNDAFVSFTGRSADEVLGRDCALLFEEGCEPQAAEERLLAAMSTPARRTAHARNPARDHSLQLLSVSEIHDGQHCYYVALLDERAGAAPSAGLEDMGDIVHKLRGPLSACVAWVDLLGLTSANSPEIASAVAAIKRNLDRERVLIDSLLDRAQPSPPTPDPPSGEGA
jgi:signal transduction histidine kinase